MEQICSSRAAFGQLHSIDRVLHFNIGTFMHQRQRKCAEKLWPLFRSVSVTVIQSLALTVIRTLAGTSASIPTESLSQTSFKTLKVLRPKKTLMLE
jgi:hypothetical protein